MKSLTKAFQSLTRFKPYINVSLRNGEVEFRSTSTHISDLTFKNPFGSDPEKAVSNIYDAMNRYRGPIIALCRKIAEAWNKDNAVMSSMGFKITQLKFIE